MTDGTNNDSPFDLERLRKRDKRVFRHVYDAYVGLLIYTAVRSGVSRTDAKDVVQDVFVKLWESATNIESMAALKTWLVVSTRNRAIDVLRQHKMVKTLGDDPPKRGVEGDSESPETNASLWHEIQVTLVGEIVETLCEENQEYSFKRFYVEGKSAKEIAFENGEPISTVTNRISRMRKLFRLKFTERLQALRDSSLQE